MLDAVPPSTDAGRRILIVDDDKDALRILGDFLEARGYDAISAHDGHEALARFHDDGPFDVIVLDVMMPGIDGLEVCRRLKASPQGQLTPVLLLSARSDTRSRIAGLYGGADDYMSKPVDLREFAARVDVLLRVRDRYRELADRRKDALDAALGDGLSGAVNGAYFLRRLQEEIGRSDRYTLPLTVVVVDLQGLPEPESESGSDPDEEVEAVFAGPADKLIESVGRSLRAALRSHDLLARLRRSRFAVMLPHTSRHSVQPALRRLQDAVASVRIDPSEDGGPAAGLSARLGYAELGPRMDATTLLARAEPR
jgi:PleD family two-component response regulator